MGVSDDKCKYCYYNTVLSCNENPEECEDYELNHLAEKYDGKRFQAKWEDGNDVHVLMTDNLEQFPDWYFETVEDAEQLTDFMNELWQESQDIEDLYCDTILILLKKYLKANNKDKISVLEELLNDTGNEDLLVDLI